MRHLYRLILIISCLLVFSCNTNNGINQARNNLVSSNHFSSSVKTNGLPIFFLPSAVSEYMIHISENNAIVVTGGSHRVQIADTPGGGPRLMAAVEARHAVPTSDSLGSYKQDVFITVSQNRLLNFVVSEYDFSDDRDPSGAHGASPYTMDGDNPVGIASNGHGIAIAITNTRVYRATLTQIGSGWRFRAPSVYSAPADSNFTAVVYDPSSRRFVITGFSQATGRHFYLVSTDDGQTWQYYDYYIPGPDSTGGGAAYLGLGEFATWSGQPFSGFSDIVFCYVPDQINNESNIKPSVICNKYLTSTDQNIIGVASNYLSYPSGSESTSLILAAGVGGDIIRSVNNGQTWSTIARLDFSSNISSLYGILYNEFTGLYYVAGYDKKGIDVILASADGINWENINVPIFGSIFSTPNSYCAIENDPNDPVNIGTVYCWGNNSYNHLAWGQLTSGLLAKAFLKKDTSNPKVYGLSELEPIIGPLNAFIPSEIANPQGVTSAINYKRLAGGSYHYCGLRIDAKSIDCWGAGDSGQLGDRVNYPVGYTTNIPSSVVLTQAKLPIQDLIAGGSHSCLLDSIGNALCWGSNLNGEVDATSTAEIFTLPTMAYYNKTYFYLGIAAGDSYTCALTATRVNCWGQNYSEGSKALTQITSQSSDFAGFSAGIISAAGGTTCVLSDHIHSGKTNAWCFGYNEHGQMGNGKSGDGFTLDPQMVTSTGNQITFKTLKQSRIATCGLDDNGYAYCWGDNTYGEAGSGFANSTPIVNPLGPIMLNGKAGQFKKISLGMGSICLVGLDANTYCLGNNNQGQLGIGLSESIVLQLTLVNTVTQIESGI